MNDEKWMDMAIELAAKGHVSPNPQVGAVLVEGDSVIGKGFHEIYGGPHAERNAIDNAIHLTGRNRFPNATLYCTLEPCCYTNESKKQPPCTQAILDAGIRRLVIAHHDPNPKVRGQGVHLLRSHGLIVETACLREKAQALNCGFITRMLSGRPVLRIKLAQSLDGRVASSTGDSRWISDGQARRRVHAMRSMYDAVMVGAGTVRTDNPRLTVRLVEGRDPRIVIPDPMLSIPINSHVVKTGTIIFHSPNAPAERRRAFEEQGLTLIAIPETARRGVSYHLSLKALFAELGRMHINTLLIEGGAGITTSLVKEGLFDEYILFIAPIIIGKGIEGVADLGTRVLKDVKRLIRVRWEEIGDQILFSAWNREAPCLQEL